MVCLFREFSSQVFVCNSNKCIKCVTFARVIFFTSFLRPSRSPCLCLLEVKGIGQYSHTKIADTFPSHAPMYRVFQNIQYLLIKCLSLAYKILNQIENIFGYFFYNLKCSFLSYLSSHYHIFFFSLEVGFYPKILFSLCSDTHTEETIQA